MTSADFYKRELSLNVEKELNSLDGFTTQQERLIQVFKDTPVLLQELGLKNLPISLPRNKITAGLFSKDSHNHGHKDEIGRKTLKKVLPLLGDPLVVSLEDDTYGIYFETKSSIGLPVYFPIRESKDGSRNIILSVYGKIPTDTEKILYIDNTRFFRRWDENSYRMLGFKKKMEDLLFLRKTLTIKPSP